MLQALIIVVGAIVLLAWIKRAIDRSVVLNRQRRVNELLAPILRRVRDQIKDPPLGIDLVNVAQRDPVYDDLAEFFETTGRIPAEFRQSAYADLKDAVVLWKEAAVRMNQRYGLWSRQNELRAQGRGEPAPREAVRAILQRMRLLGYELDSWREAQGKNAERAAFLDKLLNSIDGTKEWARRALEAIDYYGTRNMPAEDRRVISRVRLWTEGGFVALAARRARPGALRALVAGGPSAAYAGEWLEDGDSDVDAINDAGFEVLSSGRQLSIGGQTWDAVISAHGGRGHYVARLGKMALPT